MDGVSGSTILGDGRVSLIVDMSGLIKLAGLKKPGSLALSIESSATLEDSCALKQ